MHSSRLSVAPTPLSSSSAPQAVARFLALALARLTVGFRHAPRTVEPTVLHLDKGITHWIARPLGQRVTCDEGTLWLCFDGELRDIVLEPGEVHDCQKRSTLSIHALSAGVVRVTLPKPIAGAADRTRARS